MEFKSVVNDFEVEYLRLDPVKVSAILNKAIARMVELIIAIFCR